MSLSLLFIFHSHPIGRQPTRGHKDIFLLLWITQIQYFHFALPPLFHNLRPPLQLINQPRPLNLPLYVIRLNQRLVLGHCFVNSSDLLLVDVVTQFHLALSIRCECLDGDVFVELLVVTEEDLLVAETKVL